MYMNTTIFYKCTYCVHTGVNLLALDNSSGHALRFYVKVEALEWMQAPLNAFSVIISSQHQICLQR